MTESIVSFLSRPEIWIGGLALAGFLVLFWALRGAPVGQAVRGEGEDAPASGYRDRVIAAVVLGLLLVLSGGYLALSGRVLWSLPVFAVGFGIVLSLVGVNRRYRHGSPALRRTIDLSDAALTAALIAGILIVINVLAFRYGGRPLDFTRERAFSLSPLSLKQVRSLDRPVRFTVFFGRSEVALRELVRVQQLLELYKAANPQQVTLEYVNPFTEVEKYNEIARKVPDVGVIVSQSGGGLMIEYGGGKEPERRVLRSDDLFVIPRGNGNSIMRFESRFNGEDAVTSALMNLREGKKPKVVFTIGHGEPPASGGDRRVPSDGILRMRLVSIGCDVGEIDLGQQSLSKEVALVVIHAPKDEFQPTELAKLRSYLDGGGKALVLTGSGEKRSVLEGLLKPYNIDLGEGTVIDPDLSTRNRLPRESLLVQVSPQIQQPIVDPLVLRTLLLPYTRPMRVRTPGPEGKGVNPAVAATPILRTRKEAWAETDAESLRARRAERDPKKDEPGPITVGIAVEQRAKPGERETPDPRLVVFSSGALGNDETVQMLQADLDVLMNSVSWLRGRPEMIGIAPKTHVSSTLMVDPVLRGRLILLPTLMAVLLIIGFGLSTYVARRE